MNGLLAMLLTEQLLPRPAFPIHPGSHQVIPFPWPLGTLLTTLTMSFIHVDCPAAEIAMEGSLIEVPEQTAGQSVSAMMISFNPEKLGQHHSISDMKP